MDKIDVILFRYKKEREMSKEFRKFIWIMATPMIILLVIDLVAIILSPKRWGWIILIICALGLEIWTQFFKAKWGSKRWKYKLLKLYQDRFLKDQRQLIEIINDEDLNCQQVYNLLIKKYNRMPQSPDKINHIITAISLIVALTSILVSPLKGESVEEYAIYILWVICILIFLCIIGGIAYKVIMAHSKLLDEKKSDYEYALELLEDYLY